MKMNPYFCIFTFFIALCRPLRHCLPVSLSVLSVSEINNYGSEPDVLCFFVLEKARIWGIKTHVVEEFVYYVLVDPELVSLIEYIYYLNLVVMNIESGFATLITINLD